MAIKSLNPLHDCYKSKRKDKSTRATEMERPHIYRDLLLLFYRTRYGRKILQVSNNRLLLFNKRTDQ